MMGNYDDILRTMVALEAKSLNSDNSILSSLPEGRLARVRIRGKYAWQLVTYENGRRVRKTVNDRELLEALLKKHYLMLRAGKTKKRLDVLTVALEVLQSQDPDEDALDSLFPGEWSIEDNALKQRILCPQTPKGKSWASAPYEQSSFKPEWRRLPTQAGILVRFKSDVIIVNLLNYYGIPFHYEEVLYIGDVPYAPDFTILRADGSILYWEHLGKMNDIRYMERQLSKLRSYYTAGIVLGDNLVLSFDQGDGIIDIRDIEHIIRTKILM